MSKKNRQERHTPWVTPLASHKKVGSRLLPPLSQIGPIHSTNWERDLLPEHLWLGALAQEIGLDRLPDAYNAFLDAVDEFWTNPTTCLGMMSDFALLEPERQRAFLAKHRELVDQVFCRPIGRILAFYPQCPAAWLVSADWIEAGGHLEPAVELARLRRIVSKLLPGKDEHAGRIRAVPMNRLFKHNKLFFTKNMSVVNLISRYPAGLSSDERFLVESTARSAVNAQLGERADIAAHDWPKYFWRHNYDLTVCQAIKVEPRGGALVDSKTAEHIGQRLFANSETAKEYLDLAARLARLDLYDPTRDEVLFGLFSRLTRFYCLMCEDPALWARDIAGVMLRCLTDTAIVFAYLIKGATEEEFHKFVKYGDGQEKLLMLHLQDNYPKDVSMEGQTAEQLAEQLGQFPMELLEIELGHWTNKDQRRLAQDAGFERYYRLVFSPTSGDVHGSWMSLKKTNLVHCGEVLHRFHRLPSYVEPPLFVNVVDSATALFLECVKLAKDKLAFPSMAKDPALLKPLLDQAMSEESQPDSKTD